MRDATLFWLMHRLRTPGSRARVRYLFGVDFSLGLTDGEAFSTTSCIEYDCIVTRIANGKLEWPNTMAWTDDVMFSATGTKRAHAYPKADLRRIGTQVPWRDVDPVWVPPAKRPDPQITMVRR